MDFQSPEDILKFRKRIPFNPRLILPAIVVFFAIILLTTMFYQIDKDEQGVVLFLGKYTRTTGPGLHMKLPLGIETVEPVKVTTIFKEEFGFRTSRVSGRQSSTSREMLEESLMLTGDLNSLRVTWIVQFRVKDPVKLLFKIKDPLGNIRDLSEAVVRLLVADYSVDEVISSKRDEISDAAKENLQTILDYYDSGLQVVELQLKGVQPPASVEPAFNEVNQAEQEKARVVNEALQAYNKVVPKAKGQAEKALLEAEGYAVNRTNSAQGDANRFEAVLTEYKKAPDVTRKRLYLESMQDVLSRPKEKYIIDPSQETPVVPLLDFRQEKQL